MRNGLDEANAPRNRSWNGNLCVSGSLEICSQSLWECEGNMMDSEKLVKLWSTLSLIPGIWICKNSSTVWSHTWRQRNQTFVPLYPSRHSIYNDISWWSDYYGASAEQVSGHRYDWNLWQPKCPEIGGLKVKLGKESWWGHRQSSHAALW